MSKESKEIPLEWEEMNGPGGMMWRAEVPGGWLVVVGDEVPQRSSGTDTTLNGITFVPNPWHDAEVRSTKWPSWTRKKGTEEEKPGQEEEEVAGLKALFG